MTDLIEVWCETCGCQMKLRKGKYGEFWGCTAYPKCFSTMNLKAGELQALGPSNIDIEDAMNLKFALGDSIPDGSD